MKKNKRVYQTEEQKELVKFGIVLLILIAVILGIYFLSKALIKDEVKDYEYTTGSINNQISIVGTMLNEQSGEYYVLAYDPKGSNSNAYNTYAGYYSSNKEDALKIYYLDLTNIFNKDYFVTENSIKMLRQLKN